MSSAVVVVSVVGDPKRVSTPILVGGLACSKEGEYEIGRPVPDQGGIRSGSELSTGEKAGRLLVIARALFLKPLWHYEYLLGYCRLHAWYM